MKKQQSKATVSTGAKIGIGATIAAAGVAAYLLFGKEGKKNRKVIRGWGVKMKGEIIEKFEKAKDITEPMYHTIVDQIQAKYAKIKDVDQAELAALVKDIKKHWKTISKEIKPKPKAKKK